MESHKKANAFEWQSANGSYDLKKNEHPEYIDRFDTKIMQN